MVGLTPTSLPLQLPLAALQRITCTVGVGKVVGAVGLEPTAYGLRDRRSTIELYPRID